MVQGLYSRVGSFASSSMVIWRRVNKDILKSHAPPFQTQNASALDFTT
jgi:hypothetical protein